MENTIKVGWDRKTGMYTLKPQIGYGTQGFSINGKLVSDPLLGFKNGELLVVAEKPTSITCVKSTRKQIGWDNLEEGTTITMDEYNAIIERIAGTREWDEDGDIENYRTLEDEIFAARFFRNHKAVYENIEEVLNLEIELVEYPVSEYSNIVPLYSLDAQNIFETKCKWTPNNTELFYQICQKHGIGRERIELPTHSGLRFIKIDGKYVGGMEEFERNSRVSVVDTYEGCIARMNGVANNLESLISMHIAQQSTKIVNKSTVGHLLTELTILKNNINVLDVKQKEYNSQRAILNRIAELINVYKEQS
jgi:hypothetical protein